jgi:ABC-type polysaccharide/polyol phosphate export permease
MSDAITPHLTPLVVAPPSHSSFAMAWGDIAESLRKYHLIGTLGWQDVATRYRRSRIGAFWLTINMAVMITAIGLVFGTLFQQPMKEFLPYLATGLVIWGFISTSINEGCTAFADQGGIILQVRMPLFVHVARVLWRNFIIFGHNLLIVPLVFLVFGRPVSAVALLAIPGLLLLALNLLWIMLGAAVLCARFRDISMIVQNAVQVLFFVTPIMWSASIMTERVGATAIYLNPLYSLLSIVRLPLLGELPSAANWIIAAVLAVVGWTVTLAFFGRRRDRVPYWV